VVEPAGFGGHVVERTQVVVESDLTKDLVGDLVLSLFQMIWGEPPEGETSGCTS